jgi:hypothetical protein
LPFLFIGENAGDLKSLAVRRLTRKATLLWQKSQQITSGRVFTERMLHHDVTGFLSRWRRKSGMEKSNFIRTAVAAVVFAASAVDGMEALSATTPP